MKWPWVLVVFLILLLLLVEFSWLGNNTLFVLERPSSWALWILVATLGVFLGLHIRKRMNS